MGAFRVTAPFVTLKVTDVNGVVVVKGYYLDGHVQDPVQDETFDKHVRNGWLEEVGPNAEPEAPEPEPTPVVERPAGNASLEAWASYALESDQASEDEVKGLSRDELRELYG